MSLSIDDTVECPHCGHEIEINQLDYFSLTDLARNESDQRESACANCEKTFSWYARLTLTVEIEK